MFCQRLGQRNRAEALLKDSSRKVEKGRRGKGGGARGVGEVCK